MYQAKWKDRVFAITPKNLKILQELNMSYKIKKKDDNTNSTTKIGNELQTFNIEYNVSIIAGTDVLNEYKTIKSYLGLYAPLLVQGTLYGPNNVMLKNVSLKSEHITPEGKLLDGKITLSFEEYSINKKNSKTSAMTYKSPIKRTHFEEEPKAVADGDLKIFYNSKDITDSISVNSCIHDMFACSTADTLTLKFNDIKRLWDGWQAKNEEIISVTYGIAKTGAMFINSVKPENGTMTLRASSIPPTAKNKHNKSWENVKLLQLAKEIADRNNLGFDSYGVTDRLYAYVRQENISDFEFLQKRCELESLAFIVYDKKLVLYSEEYLEKQTPAKTIQIETDTDFTYTDNAQKGYGKITVKNGDITGSYTSKNGLSRAKDMVISTYISGQDEANRFAEGILRQENKNLASGIFKDAIMREFSAGSIIDLKTVGANSWNGNIFVSHLRQDYVNLKTKMFFRKAEVM